MRTLVLTVTRRCNLRCSYCPTAKEGWPELTPAQARRAVALFATRYGGGEVKVFGGEPLLAPEAVGAALEEAARWPAIRRFQLSTNGTALDRAWLDRLARHPGALLVLSMDGRPADHRRHRRALPGAPDAYDRVLGLLPALLAFPRLVVTLTIPPGGARHLPANLDHLLGLGFTRFNLLPGYYLAWRDHQLEALRRSLRAVAARIRERWEAGRPFTLRNLFVRAPLPFFNTGMVVDADGAIHPANVQLAATLEDLGARTRVGDLDDPPTPEALAEAARRVPALLEERVPPRAMASTRAVDALLTAFCEDLYPDYFAWRARRRAARARVGA